MKNKRKIAAIMMSMLLASGMLASNMASIIVNASSTDLASSSTTGNSSSGEKPTGNPSSGEKPTGNPPRGEKPTGNPPSGKAQSGGGADTQSYDYAGTMSGALVADGKEVISKGETTSTKDKDQNAALVKNSGTLKITNGELTKSGDDEDGDNCNFYGINSILLSAGYISFFPFGALSLTI